MNTAGQQQTDPARAGRLAQPGELPAGSPGCEDAHRLAEARPDDVTRSGARRAGAAARRAEERAKAARSVACPCQAAPGVPCGPSGDHLARYLSAGQRGAITRESLKEVIAALAVIGPQALIQPPGERAAHAAGAGTAGHLIRAQMDAGMTPDRIEASAESVPGGRSGHFTARSGPFYRGYGEVAGSCAREARELEAGAPNTWTLSTSGSVNRVFPTRPS